MDVPRRAHAHGGPEEDHDYQRVDGDLLGPGQAVVQRVAGEELQEDAERPCTQNKARVSQSSQP